MNRNKQNKDKMRLKYCIEFSEAIDSVDDITDEELVKIKLYMDEHLRRFITYSGAYIRDFKVQFDLEEE